MKIIVFSVLFAFQLGAQPLAAIVGGGSSTSGGFGTPNSAICHTSTTAVTGCALNTTGDNLVTMHIAVYQSSGGNGTASSSDGSTWNCGTMQGGNGSPQQGILTCWTTPVSPGSGFTAGYACPGGSNCYPEIVLVGVSGAAASSPHDQANGSATASNVFSFQPGSVTPGVNGELIVTALQISDNGTGTINDGFTILQQNAGSAGAYQPIAVAYLIQATAAAINPTWSQSYSAGPASAVIDTFKP